MSFSFLKNTLFLFVLLGLSCGNHKGPQDAAVTPPRAQEPSEAPEILPGADRPAIYLPLMQGKKIGLVANQTSMVHTRGLHLADFLLDREIELVRVFAPEHGFRGTADAGEAVQDGADHKTGLPIVSLYGANKKPLPHQVDDLDLVVFDIQDVGARFYTYISTLHYVMEACAQNKVSLLILDRPNPNGHYMDGPILKPGFKSFVGMHPVPVVHGMTIGEYARMINGEGWLENGIKCTLQVVNVEHYRRDQPYSLPVRPSPNLPNDKAVNLYPSLCFFEGTVVSAGRGTDMPFEVFGAPLLPAEAYPYTFTPKPNQGAKFPKFEGQLCRGLDLSKTERLDSLNLEWLIEAYRAYPKKERYFNSFFKNLAGSDRLQKQIENGLDAAAIRKSWSEDLREFAKTRAPYLLYD